MSFTSNIKNEICNIEYSDSEKMAELSAIININAKIYNDRFEIYTENISAARRIYKLIKDIYHTNIFMDNTNVNTLRKNKLVLLTVKDKFDLILNDLSIIDDNKRIQEEDNEKEKDR